jgi:hypothetical protein
MVPEFIERDPIGKAVVKVRDPATLPQPGTKSGFDLFFGR